MSDEAAAYWFGVFTAAITATVIWHTAEAACQYSHNVADCEWSRTPFAPVVPEEAK